METINFFLLKSLQSEYDLINKRVLFLSKQYKNVYDMNNDFLQNLIFKYRLELKNIGLEILRYRFKDGCENFDFSTFESLYNKKDSTINYQM